MNERERALEVLEPVVADFIGAWESWDRRDLLLRISRVVGILRGYPLPPDVLAKYHCSTCLASGVKLWRAAHSAQEAWCATCGTAQAGLPDDIDDEGKHEGNCGPSDQIYSPKKGLGLLPWIPCADGTTWGYTSVPTEGVEWWKALPTRRPM